jgi:hypothetical protein
MSLLDKRNSNNTGEGFIDLTHEDRLKIKSQNIKKLNSMLGLKLSNSDIKYNGIDDTSIESVETYFADNLLYKDLRNSDGVKNLLLKTDNVNGITDFLIKESLINPKQNIYSDFADRDIVFNNSSYISSIKKVLMVLQTLDNYSNFDKDSTYSEELFEQLINKMLINCNEFNFIKYPMLLEMKQVLSDFLDFIEEQNKNSESPSSVFNFEFLNKLQFLLDGISVELSRRDINDSFQGTDEPLDLKKGENQDPILSSLDRRFRSYTYDNTYEINFIVPNLTIFQEYGGNKFNIDLFDSEVFRYFSVNEIFLNHIINLYNFKSLVDQGVIPVDRSISEFAFNSIPVNYAFRLLKLFPDLRLTYMNRKVTNHKDRDAVLQLLSNSTEKVNLTGSFKDIFEHPNFQKILDVALNYHLKIKSDDTNVGNTIEKQ